MTVDQFIKAFNKRYKACEKCVNKDHEYNTSTGNGVNSCEAFHVFREIKELVDQLERCQKESTNTQK